MAEFNVDKDGNVTLQFNVKELCYVTSSRPKKDIFYTPEIEKFASMTAHLVERKRTNVSVNYDEYLKKMGLHKYSITSTDRTFNNFEGYYTSKEAAEKDFSHLGGVKVTEDKKWYGNYASKNDEDKPRKKKTTDYERD